MPAGCGRDDLALNAPPDRLAEVHASATGNGPLEEILAAAAAVCDAAPSRFRCRPWPTHSMIARHEQPTGQRR
ncbi:hypothetical protein [Actinomadura sp. 6N118]|uniref:hypothetical protein n=1 Tax=Actinomadura sp. 6N118 TaxID=3375151 RepID=UPI0037B16ECB